MYFLSFLPRFAKYLYFLENLKNFRSFSLHRRSGWEIFELILCIVAVVGICTPGDASSSVMAFHMSGCIGNNFRDVLPELKELIVCIFDVIGVENLIRKFQAELAEVIGTFPAKVVDIIAEYFVLHIDEATVLSSAGTGLLTAFARRIVSVDCAESIAKVNGFCLLF